MVNILLNLSLKNLAPTHMHFQGKLTRFFSSNKAVLRSEYVKLLKKHVKLNLDQPTYL